MSKKLAIAMFGQKRLSREGGVEIVVKELCTRMAQNGCDVTCYNRAGHHVSGAEYDDAGKTEYEGIRQKAVPTIERRGLAAVSSSACLRCRVVRLGDLGERKKRPHLVENAGQYLSTKEVQQQFAKAIFKKKFRAEHSKELDAYAESVKYFREENDGKLPSLKSLKKRKEKLTQEIAERKKAYAPLREESRRLEIASDNVYSIFRKTDEMKSDLAWKREWEAKVREKARQEQARQEKRERQPKRKKRSYDMSL